ncbi:MAG: phosphonate ABC transporter, permease protein PhnE [Magnetovibrionaceae bacterium]
MTDRLAAPDRFERPGLIAFGLYLLAITFVVLSIQGAEMSIVTLIEGVPDMGRMLGEMMPPSLTRIESVGWSLLETFQMAVAGTVFGVLISLPLAVLAARNLSPHPLVYHAARGLISFFRTVPDLIWALFFVVTVGLGPFAGALALVVDTIGFCGRFFAEAMEEVDPAPSEALDAIGVGPAGVFAGAVLPAAAPSFINTGLFSLEKATRSSVVLGLVGAGGIGIELKVAMDMFQYAEAATIILAIFGLVLVVEQASAAFRRKLI